MFFLTVASTLVELALDYSSRSALAISATRTRDIGEQRRHSEAPYFLRRAEQTRDSM